MLVLHKPRLVADDVVLRRVLAAVGHYELPVHVRRVVHVLRRGGAGRCEE